MSDSCKIKPVTKRHFQKTVYDASGISPTIRDGHGDVVRIILNDIEKTEYKKEEKEESLEEWFG